MPAPLTVRPPPGTSSITPAKVSAAVIESTRILLPRTTVLAESPVRSWTVVVPPVTPEMLRVEPVMDTPLLAAIDPDPVRSSVPALIAVAPV